MAKSGLTLSSPDENIRKFWIDHGKACIRISEYFARETGIPCVINIWTGDGLKDIPADRMGPRMRYKDSLEQILSEKFDKSLVKPCVESKVFGIGVESYTVGSAEFTLNFAATGGECRVIYHAHPANIIAMTYILPLTAKDFTKALWQCATECPVVFPGGVGVVPWMVPILRLPPANL